VMYLGDVTTGLFVVECLSCIRLVSDEHSTHWESLAV
jgi:hypothetical protein